MQEFSIGEVMRMTGLSRATILYYENKNLIHPRQEESGYRKYSIDEVMQIVFYQNLKQIDLTVGDYADAVCQENGGRKVKEIVLRKKLAYMRRLSAQMAMLRYWEEAQSIVHAIEHHGMRMTSGESYEAWFCPLREDKHTQSLIKNWDNHFLQRNLSYAFKKEAVEAGDYSFERGLSCYAECAMELDRDIKPLLRFYPYKYSVMMMQPFDTDTEDFQPLFEAAFEELSKMGYVLDGDPWAHFAYKDVYSKPAVNYLFTWLPVRQADERAVPASACKRSG